MPLAAQPGAMSASPLGCCGGDAQSMPVGMDTLPGLLRTGGHASALGDLPASWRRYGVQFLNVDGALHGVQEPGGVQQIRLSGEGARALARWQAVGRAEVVRRREREAMWRNQSTESLSSLYVWADSIGGTFRSDGIVLTAGIASPAWHAINFGVLLDHGLAQGARRNDPRPLYRRRTAAFVPSLRWTHGAHELGVQGRIGWQREDVEIGGGLSSDAPVVFRLRGIATYDRTQLNSAERALLGRTIGAGGAYAWHGTRSHLAVDADWRVSTDSVRDGIATPTFGGRTQWSRMVFTAQARRRHGRSTTDVTLRYRQDEAPGTDPVFAAINAMEDHDRMELQARWWSGTGSEDSLHAGLSTAPWIVEMLAARETIGARDVAAAAHWSIERLPLQVRLTRQIRFGSRDTWWIRGGVAGGVVTTSALFIGIPSRMSAVLAAGDYAVRAASTMGYDLQWGWEHRRTAGERLRVAVGWQDRAARIGDAGTAGRVHRREFTMQFEVQ